MYHLSQEEKNPSYELQTGCIEIKEIDELKDLRNVKYDNRKFHTENKRHIETV